MKVLLAGATGAIGSPLIGKLLADGHAVFGMTQSAQRAADLNAKGAEAIIADVLDAASVSKAISRIRPVAIINELTSLPKRYTPEEMEAAGPRDAEVRIKRATPICWQPLAPPTAADTFCSRQPSGTLRAKDRLTKTRPSLSTRRLGSQPGASDTPISKRPSCNCPRSKAS